MGILYLITLLALIIAFILIKKTGKKIEIISFTAITIVLTLCYNAFVAYIFTFVRIPITLLSLSITNLIITAIIVTIMVKKKEIQKYTLNKINLISISIILIVTLVASYANFGIPFSIKYETGDPATHYVTSVLFEENDSLLTTEKDQLNRGFRTRKTASYVNSGIIMKCCSEITEKVDFYKIFIAFGIFVLFMTGTMMYLTLEKLAKDTKSKILALIVSIIFMIGYPFNSLLFGFEYLSLGILILCTIIHVIYYFEKEELKFIYSLIIFALLNFGQFCAYYMFVPFTYSALWIYFCIHSYRKNKKIICKENIITLAVTLLIPFILCFIYYFMPTVFDIFNVETGAIKSSINYSTKMLNGGFATEGYIYENYYSNMLPLIPLTLYYILKKRKEKKLISFDTILLISTLVFMEILLIGIGFHKVSEYYYMKNYYALWIILIYINFKALMYIFQKSKIKAYLIIGVYTLLILSNLLFIKVPVTKKQILGEHENLLSVTEIFNVNKNIICNIKEDLTPKEIDILRYVYKNCNLPNSHVEIVGDPEQLYWASSMLRYVNQDDLTEKHGGEKLLNLKYTRLPDKIGTADYMVYFKKSTSYKILENDLFVNSEIVYQNEAGGIIKYNK